MNQPDVDIKADRETVEEISDFLVRSLDTYIQSKDREVRFIDVFMGIHSFHKAMVFLIGKNWKVNGIPEWKTYQMADITFRNAMKQLRKSALTPPTR